VRRGSFIIPLFYLFSLYRLSAVPSFLVCTVVVVFAASLFDLYRISGVPSAFLGLPVVDAVLVVAVFVIVVAVAGFEVADLVLAVAVAVLVVAVVVAGCLALAVVCAGVVCALEYPWNPRNSIKASRRFFMLKQF
jgi:hypothetical protein